MPGEAHKFLCSIDSVILVLYTIPFTHKKPKIIDLKVDDGRTFLVYAIRTFIKDSDNYFGLMVISDI